MRKNEIFTDLIEYLNNGKNYKSPKRATNDRNLPALANKSVLISTANQMLLRIFEEDDVFLSSSMTLDEKPNAVVKTAEEEKKTLELF